MATSISDIGLMAANIATSAAITAVYLFVPPPASNIIAMALGQTMMIAELSVIGGMGQMNDLVGVASAIGGGILSSIPGGAGAVMTKASAQLSKVSANVAANSTKISNALKKVVDFNVKISKKISNASPSAMLDKTFEKLTKTKVDTNLADNKLILKKEAEIKQYGEVRTKDKINSMKVNPEQRSPIKCVTFVETKFINRNEIKGNLTFYIYKNNDSRLGNRVHSLNGNESLYTVVIPDARYKNEYVSGICRAQSWMSYYMKHWMLGQPGRGKNSINTGILFGQNYRLDLKLKSLAKQWKNLGGESIKWSQGQAKNYLGKNKYGSYLFESGDVFKKGMSLKQGDLTWIKSESNKFIKSGLKKWKK